MDNWLAMMKEKYKHTQFHKNIKSQEDIDKLIKESLNDALGRIGIPKEELKYRSTINNIVNEDTYGFRDSYLTIEHKYPNVKIIYYTNDGVKNRDAEILFDLEIDNENGLHKKLKNDKVSFTEDDLAHIIQTFIRI